MFLWTPPALRAAYAAHDLKRLMLKPALPSRISSAKEPAVAPTSAAAPYGPKVMLRPRLETSADRCQGTMASANAAVTVSAIRAGSLACDASLSRAHSAHPFNHSQAGFRSRRLAPSTWRRAVRQPVIKRLVNVQQNARRCDPPGGDAGGCSARPSCRRIRLRVRKP